jgi:hypothetical protein
MVLSSLNFLAKMILVALLTNMEMEVGKEFPYTSIYNSCVGLASSWNLFKIVVSIWLKYFNFSLGPIVAVNSSSIMALVVVSYVNLSKNSF